MKIGEILKKASLYNAERTSESTRVTDDAAQGRNRETVEAEDTVSISPRARQFQQISTLVSQDEDAQQRRLDEIKARVDRGEYNVPSDEVAKAFLSYYNGEA